MAFEPRNRSAIYDWYHSRQRFPMSFTAIPAAIWGKPAFTLNQVWTVFGACPTEVPYRGLADLTPTFNTLTQFITKLG
jgi:hypothetical protein